MDRVETPDSEVMPEMAEAGERVIFDRVRPEAMLLEYGLARELAVAVYLAMKRC